jgi:hypothetical protein
MHIGKRDAPSDGLNLVMKTLDFFIHMLRYRRNAIAMFTAADGTSVTEHRDKEEIIFRSFKEILGTSDQPQMMFDLPTLIHPTPGLVELSAPFTEEIDVVVNAMPIDKAPRGLMDNFLRVVGI